MPYAEYCTRGVVERIIKHEAKPSALLVLQTTTRVQYERKARAKGTLTGLLYEETMPLASVVFCCVLKLFLRLLPEYRTRAKGKQTGLLR